MSLGGNKTSSSSNSQEDTYTMGTSVSNTVGSMESTTTGTEQLVLSDTAINSIIDSILSSSGGLADIFSEANVAGVYDSSVSTEATSDLMANIAGQIAQLTGVKTTTSSTTGSSKSSTVTDSNSITSTSKKTAEKESGSSWGLNVVDAVGLF
jgi:hypothetical protein